MDDFYSFDLLIERHHQWLRQCCRPIFSALATSDCALPPLQVNICYPKQQRRQCLVLDRTRDVPVDC